MVVRLLPKLLRLRDNLEESGLSQDYFEAVVREVVQEQSALKEAELEGRQQRGTLGRADTRGLSELRRRGSRCPAAALW